MAGPLMLIAGGVGLAAQGTAPAATDQAPTAPHGASAGAHATAPALPQGVFLRINGKDVPRQRFLEELGDSMGDSYRDTFISHVLLEQKAAASGVSVSTAEVEAAVRKNVDQVVKDRFSGDEHKLEEALHSRGMTLEGWKRRGRVDARYDTLANKLIRQQRSVSDDDVKRLFEERYGKGGVQTMVRNIKKSVLVAASPDFTPQQFSQEKDKIDAEARGIAEEALKKLRGGESFESVLAAYSDDPRKGQGGTIIGAWKGRFGADFDQAASQLKKDELSDVIKCSDGYRIAQLTGITNKDEVHALHILVATGDEEEEGARSDADARKKAAELLAQIKAGADFATLAKENSDDPGSAQKGGDLGFFGRHTMAQPFEDAVFALEPGQVSEPVKTNFGYHIIKLVEKRQSEDRTFRQILISTQFARVKDRRLRPTLEARAQAELQDIAAKLDQPGASFADLAKSSSDDGVTKTEGGLIKNYREGVYGGAFDDTVKEMKKGDKPKIAKDAAGNLHLVKLDGIVKTDYASVEGDLRKELMQRDATPQEKSDYFKKLRDAATIVP